MKDSEMSVHIKLMATLMLPNLSPCLFLLVLFIFEVSNRRKTWTSYSAAATTTSLDLYSLIAWAELVPLLLSLSGSFSYWK